MRRALLALAMMVVVAGCQTGGIGTLGSMSFMNISKGVNGALGQLGVAILDSVWNRAVTLVGI